MINTPTASSGAGVTCGGGKVAVVILPVTLAGLVAPSPVMNTCTMLPLAAALPGPFTLLSWFRIAPGPLPCEFCANSPGTVVADVNRYPLEVCPTYLINTVGLAKGAISYGTIADTCVLLA